MSIEQKIQEELSKAFKIGADKFKIPRERRVFAEIPVEKLLDIVRFVKETLGFWSLSTITGQDEGENFSFLYHFIRQGGGAVLNLKVFVPKSKPVAPSITGIFPHAVFYERELCDLLGAKITGLPEGNRYPLPENWPEGQYPLRKDWKPEMLDKIKTKEG